MSSTIPEYLTSLQKALEERADPEAAMQMTRYVKGKFAFYGIPAPDRRELLRLHVRQEGPVPEQDLPRVIQWCWNADQREWQYICMELLGRRSRKAGEGNIKDYQFLIINKSWWDTVDYIASNLVGPYFRIYPEKIAPVTSHWMESRNMWLQRTCLLFQLKYRGDTDTGLLTGFIEQLKDSKEFFIRKAIGWSLREYSKTNPDFVISFVRNNHLSGLSEREALKWIQRKGKA